MGIYWQRVSAADESTDRAWLDLVAALDFVPLPALILGHEGIALRANAAWADFSFAAQDEARGTEWLRVVEAAGRDELLARLRSAAADATAGSADCWLEGAASQPRRPSRWWWQPGPAGQIIAFAADLSTRAQGTCQPLGAVLTAGAADGQSGVRHKPAGAPSASADVLDEMVRRLFGTGLLLQRVLGGADGHTAARLDQIVAALDEMIGDARTAALGPLRSQNDP